MLWDTVKHPELTDSIQQIPIEYQGKFNLVFTHYDLDKIFRRIGINEKQKAQRSKRIHQVSWGKKQKQDSQAPLSPKATQKTIEAWYCLSARSRRYSGDENSINQLPN